MSAYIGNPAGSETTIPKPAFNTIPKILIPVDQDAVTAEKLFINPYKTFADWISFLIQNGSTPFGGGQDGALNIDGITETMNTDLYCSSVEILNAGILKTNGGRLFVRDTLSIVSGCEIQCNGNNGVGAVRGSAGNTITLGTNTRGGNGNIDSGGDDGATSPDYNVGINTEAGGSLAFGGRGGDFVIGGGGHGSGGGYTTQYDSTMGNLNYNIQTFGAWVSAARGVKAIAGGTGGGGGSSGGGGFAGGGGGAGGRVIFIAARNIQLSGSFVLSASGGNGGNATGGNAGGGGGGGGGTIVLAYNNIQFSGGASIDDLTPAQCCISGSGGNGSGTGENGVAGLTGNLFLVQL